MSSETISGAGGPSPLDLAAIEARHEATMNGFSSDPGTYVASAADVPALLALLRETRAALSRYVVASAPSSPLVDQGIRLLVHVRALTARLESSTHVLDAMATLAGDSVTRELAALNRDRNRVVLGAAQDGEAGP